MAIDEDSYRIGGKVWGQAQMDAENPGEVAAAITELQEEVGKLQSIIESMAAAMRKADLMD